MVKAQICLPVLNLYAQPALASEVVSQALYGWTVQLLEEKQVFQQIQTPDGYVGWVEKRGLTLSEISTKEKLWIKLIHNAVPIYATPNIKQYPLWILPFEVELAVLAEPIEEEGGWLQVQLVEGRSGWVQRGHVQVKPAPLSLGQMLTLSRQFLGLPYLWGGTSSFGFDCSGFVQMLWRQRGVMLPRDARQQHQHAYCMPVAWSNIEAGDLVFYGLSETEVSHVALYLRHQTLIHASVKPIPLLQEVRLDDASLAQRFAYQAVRRVLMP